MKLALTQLALTQLALLDLKSIANYTQKYWGKTQRNIYLKQLDEAFQLICQNPHAGVECNYIKAGYRKLPIASHVVYYRIVNDTVEIIRALHKNMDVNQVE